MAAGELGNQLLTSPAYLYSGGLIGNVTSLCQLLIAGCNLILPQAGLVVTGPIIDSLCKIPDSLLILTKIFITESSRIIRLRCYV